MAVLNMANLSSQLKEIVEDSGLELGEKLSDGFGNMPYFTKLQTRDKIPLIADWTTSILQPGEKGTFNPTTNPVSFKNRMGQIQPVKADLTFTEADMKAWRASYFAKVSGANPKSPYEFTFLQHVMQLLFKRIGNDIELVKYSGVLNTPGTTYLDIFDGLSIQLQQGIATTGTGWVGDIPVSNVLAYVALTKANILGQIELLVDKLSVANPNLIMQDGVLLMAPEKYMMIARAERQTLSNGAMMFRNQSGELFLSDLPNYKVIPCNMLAGKDKLILTPGSNLFWLSNDLTNDIPSMEVEYAQRNIHVMLDFKAAINYGRGEFIFTNAVW
jgi:hypothetical protein